MSKTILTIDEYRSLETRAGNMLGHDALMLRAGTAAADFIAERIPEGGRVTAKGTPAEVARTDTHTGRALREHLAR